MKKLLDSEMNITEENHEIDEDKDQIVTLPFEVDEIEKNRNIVESKHITNNILNSNSNSDLGPPDLLPPPLEVESLGRQLSLDFTLTESFEEISNLNDLISWTDKNGSTCCHYLARINLPKSYKAIVAAGASKVISNKFKETPQGILDGVDFSSDHSIQLHSIICKRQNIPINILKYALTTPKDYKINDQLIDIEEAILDNNRKNDALLWSESAVKLGIPHAELYYAIALLEADFSVCIAKIQIENYEKTISAVGEVDPIYFYCKYFLWKKEGSIKKIIIRLAAADNLAICRLFPSLEEWLIDTDIVDLDVVKEGLDDNIEAIQLDSDSDSDEDNSMNPDSPESQWKLAKTKHNGESKSMDDLMKLTGLCKIKNRAVTVFKEVLLNKIRQKAGITVKADTSMNFLFVGNPGKYIQIYFYILYIFEINLYVI
jgi:hypothetical protein